MKPSGDFSNFLAFQSPLQLIAALGALLPEVTEVDLRWNSLGRKPAAALPPIFDAISSLKITSLDLSGNVLSKTPIDQLVPLLNKCSNITSLNLSANSLGEKTAQEWTQIFKAISSKVTTLNLSENNLGGGSVWKWIKMLRAFPKTVNELDLSHNHLELIPTQQFIRILKRFPKNITTLHLRLNFFGRRTHEEWIAIFSAWPKKITRLNLSGNDFLQRTPEELIAIFEALPKWITSLDLGWNTLGELTSQDIIKILQALPKGMTLLNLSGNGLRQKNTQEMIEILSALPPEVELNLSENYLEDRAGIELLGIFDALKGRASGLYINTETFKKMVEAVNPEQIPDDAKRDEYFKLLIKLYNRVYRCNHKNAQSDVEAFALSLLQKYFELYEGIDEKDEIVQTMLRLITTIPKEHTLDILSPLTQNIHLFLHLLTRVDLSEDVLRRWVLLMLTNKQVPLSKLPNESWFQNKGAVVSAMCLQPGFYQSSKLNALSDKRQESNKNQEMYDRAAGLEPYPSRRLLSV